MPSSGNYKARFEKMFAELRATPGVTVEEAEIAPPDPEATAKWKAVAGAEWPEGMSELYAEVGKVDLFWSLDGAEMGAIHIPAIGSVWDSEGLEGDLWFGDQPENHPFRKMRPIDRFIPEACAVLYQGKVAFHYCGEELTPLDLPFEDWLALLFRSRGVMYWLQELKGPRDGQTWVEDNIDKVAKLFPDYEPETMSPAELRPELELPERELDL